MSKKIGKLYTEAEIEHTARSRAKADAEHDVVIWKCGKCGAEQETPVPKGINSRQCECGRWMVWYYKPLQAA